uniref:Uncharacterized protein n=1 Tax=Apis cerana TaxID=7461 RepID=V9I862_APICE
MSALPSALRLTCCRSWLLLICLLCLVSGCTCRGTRPDRLTRQLPADDDVRVSNYDDDDVDEDYQDNATAKGQQLGSPCDVSCNPKLQHVFCDTVTGFCECEKFYPVRLGPSKGCAKHLVLITTDIPTLLCIASGIAVFTAMICFVLKLFSRARYSRPRHYANANHAPPMLFSSDTGIPLTLHGGRPSSRSSQRSSTGGPLTYAFSRRPSSGGSRGPLVPSSRAGSRRPSLTSVHSSTSSARSYSARRLEKERNEKEQRQALQELRLAKQREQQQREQQQQIAPTPSPRTPHSMDELLPSVEEGKEVFYNEQVPTTSDMIEETSMKTTAVTTTNINASRFGEMAPVTTSTTSIFETNIAPRATGDIFQV